MVLEVNDLRVGYLSDIEVLKGVTLRAESNKVTSVIGPNGAGKSTLLKVVAGILKPWSGSVKLLGKRVDGASPEQLVRMGLSYVPQRRSVFPRMTVRENLELGAWIMKKSKADVKERMDFVLSLFPELREYLDTKAGLLSGGLARMLEIARALMPNPKVLVLDEPSFGLSPLMVERVYKFISQVRASNSATILLVDQNIRKCVEVSDYVYVLSEGRIIGGGPREYFSEHLSRIVTEWLSLESPGGRA